MLCRVVRLRWPKQCIPYAIDAQVISWSDELCVMVAIHAALALLFCQAPNMYRMLSHDLPLYYINTHAYVLYFPPAHWQSSVIEDPVAR